jgi:hypothetical protein
VKYCWRKDELQNLEQGINIKFCVKIGKSSREILILLTWAYYECCMTKENVFAWHGRCDEGLENAQDNPRGGHSKTQRTDANVERPGIFLRSDGRFGVKLITEEICAKTGAVRQIMYRIWE